MFAEKKASVLTHRGFHLERETGFEPATRRLRTEALKAPRGAQHDVVGEERVQVPVDAQKKAPVREHRGFHLERETGFEPATSTLARSHSTAELLPQ